MASNRGPLNERHVADALRALASEHAREREPFDKRRAWQRIEQNASAAPHSRWEAHRGRLSVAAVVLATGALAGGAYWKSAAQLSYEARGVKLIDGTLSTDGASAELDFSDESQISVSPHSTFSVDVVGKHAALTRLTQGKLHVHVHHEPDTNWRFFAGRYEVQVVGTEFDLAWDEKTESLTLSMVNGEVKVLGAPGPARVVKGQGVLHLPDQSREAAVATAEPAPAASIAAAASEGAASASLALNTPNHELSARAGASGKARDASALSWDSLLKNGQFAAVVDGAEAMGVEHALLTAGANDLKALAHAARYTGRAALSLRAWHALRSRFASLPLGAQASFFLGRTYEEQGNAPEALRWLGVYASEAPGGVYASEALGRKLNLLLKTSGKAAALSSARDYLHRFPGGAYEKTARGVVEAE